MQKREKKANIMVALIAGTSSLDRKIPQNAREGGGGGNSYMQRLRNLRHLGYGVDDKTSPFLAVKVSFRVH